MAGRRDAKTDESSQSLAATIVAASIFQGLFLGAIAWLVWGQPMYWAVADGMSLQAQVVLIAAMPALLSGYWLAELYLPRLWRRRLSLGVVIDILAWLAIVLYSAPACRCGSVTRRSASTSWVGCRCSCSDLHRRRADPFRCRLAGPALRPPAHRRRRAPAAALISAAADRMPTTPP